MNLFKKHIQHLLKLTIILFVFSSCNLFEKETRKANTYYWLMDLNDGGKVTSTADGSSITSDIRFLARGTSYGETPAGEWNIEIEMFTYLGLNDNTNGMVSSGYYSGELYFPEFEQDVSELLLGILNPETQTTAFYSTGTFEMPYFYTNPGQYYVEVVGDDGSVVTIDGQQPILTCWPETMNADLRGASKKEISEVEIFFDMVDNSELAVNDLSCSGAIYKFETEAERDGWLLAHPQPDYLANPKLIPLSN